MTNSKKAIIGLVIACGILGGTVYSLAAGGSPGSEADPLVSKSYVDEKIKEISDNSSSVSVDTEAIVSRVLAKVQSQSGTAAQSYSPVSIKAGDIVIAHEGTEIILRSGTAKAYVPGSNGISDVTSGKDIFNNEKIGSNHLLIVARSDGRGVSAETDCWLLIKGGYEFLN